MFFVIFNERMMGNIFKVTSHISKKLGADTDRMVLEFFREKLEEAVKLTAMQKAGILPIRVTHNDTKCNNVLFDTETHAALAVIALDTVMLGLALHDFGDAVRFLDDYITGDRYFKTDYPGHNLDRCRSQLALAKDVLKKYDELNERIKEMI